jgi:glycerophosphoryl diester phosphodiesterase
MIHQAESVGAGIVTPAYTLVTEALIDDVHAHGLYLCTYTVDHESDMLRMIDLDVDGIITNYPNRLKALQSSD